MMWKPMESGEKGEANLPYSFTLDLCGPLTDMSSIPRPVRHSGRSLTPGMAKGKSYPVHLVTRHTILLVSSPL